MATPGQLPICLQVLIHYGTGRESDSRGFYLKFRVLNKKFRTSASVGQVWNEYFVIPVPRETQLMMELWCLGDFYAKHISSFLVDVGSICSGEGMDVDNSFPVKGGMIRVQVIGLYDFAHVIGLAKPKRTAIVERVEEEQELPELLPMESVEVAEEILIEEAVEEIVHVSTEEMLEDFESIPTEEIFADFEPIPTTEIEVVESIPIGVPIEAVERVPVTEEGMITETVEESEVGSVVDHIELVDITEEVEPAAIELVEEPVKPAGVAELLTTGYKVNKLVISVERLNQMDVFLFPLLAHSIEFPLAVGESGFPQLRPLVSNVDNLFHTIQFANLGQFSIVESVLTSKRYLQSSMQSHVPFCA